MKRALIALSGGVDSAVSAYLLREQGGELTGAILRMTDPADSALSPVCSARADEDIASARALAESLGIPFLEIPAADCFRRHVMLPFAETYLAGQTPNPCVFCNRHVKLGFLLDVALERGCAHVATGHYARILREGDRYLLAKAKDPRKDQSYMLYSLTQTQLASLVLPLGDLTKDQVRMLAAEQGFSAASRRESQDICFVPDGDYATVVERLLGRTSPSGHFVDRAGRVLGTHRGLLHYTEGQRKGLGIASDAPLYVCHKRAEDNTVVLGREEDLYVSEVLVRDVSWIPYDNPPSDLSASVKLRYRHPEQPAHLTVTGEGQVRITFDTPQRAPAPGQSAVFYDGDLVLGGGLIDSCIS